MKGLFILQNTNSIIEGKYAGEDVYLQEVTSFAPDVFKIIAYGNKVNCKTFKGFVKYCENYVGIRMFINNLKGMLSEMQVTPRCCIYEVELFDKYINKRRNGLLDVSADEFRGLYHNCDIGLLKVSVKTLPINYITAVYEITEVQSGVLKVHNVFDTEPNYASANCDLYTDGAGNLYNPTDDAGFEIRNDLIETLVKNHGLQTSYSGMSLGEVKNVCSKEVVDEVTLLLRKNGINNPVDSLMLGSLLKESEGNK